jgi:hypothetical protein
MDDLKLIGRSEEELQKQIQAVTTFSDNIYMEFGLDKCAKIVLREERLVHLQILILYIKR